MKGKQLAAESISYGEKPWTFSWVINRRRLRNVTTLMYVDAIAREHHYYYCYQDRPLSLVLFHSSCFYSFENKYLVAFDPSITVSMLFVISASDCLSFDTNKHDSIPFYDFPFSSRSGKHTLLLWSAIYIYISQSGINVVCAFSWRVCHREDIYFFLLRPPSDPVLHLCHCEVGNKLLCFLRMGIYI